MNTHIDAERAEQRRWQLLDEFRHLRVFDRLLESEFDSHEIRRRRAGAALSRTLRYAAANVPYYRECLHRLGLRASEFADPAELPRLPLLSRAIVQSRGKELRAERLPPGAAPGISTRTSGTTGEPVKVEHTAFSHLMFIALKQRESRWWRIDPAMPFASVRNPKDLPRVSGAIVDTSVTVARDHWPRLGVMFRTGPFIGISNATEAEAVLRWLREHRPRYLLAMAADLEQLALAAGEGGAVAGLHALFSISQQMTGEMRRLVESAFVAPVHENYGLNEIGIVASRCPVSGWFHIHDEHCLVEIVDDAGAPLPPGRRGRVVVTALSNPAMPLIRYDADDLASYTDEPCPCGRHLASLRDLFGRYRRTAYLPPGTWSQWTALQRCLADMPRADLEALRQYQLHQQLDGGFVLRVVSAGELTAGFADRIHAAWRAAGAPHAPPLSILPVAVIPRSPGGKFQNFVSDWVPPAPEAGA